MLLKYCYFMDNLKKTHKNGHLKALFVKHACLGYGIHIVHSCFKISKLKLRVNDDSQS